MSISPTSSPLISVRRGVGVLPFQLAAVLADDVQDVLPVGEDAAVLGDLLQQLAMLAGQLLLLQVDQLAERHSQDGVGLDGRERVELACAAFFDEHGETLVAQRPAQQGRRAFGSASAALWPRPGSRSCG